ncbi:OmpA family protein [Candidatus Methylomicrobium oryzae]|jgi:OOP family OmpA-OmpF porin|uniref:OmpA family protein n=1 Tax=Candidatus Methylomicrobium oryzae TaxID=2802053 RepID=UPI00192414B9|nr:OmpA family protein [Methylomicrobium sp. RS1]MBL1265434.1 OmpA family protein [Methylomicrobium sp. RS1]
MNKSLIAAASLGALFLSGCASTPISTTEPFSARDLNELLTSGQYQQKTDNFYVINDSSSSMSEEYLGSGFSSGHAPAKLSVEKAILSRVNQTIPDLKLTSGIRSFGFGPCSGWESTLYNLPLTAYSKSAFNTGIDALACASGGSPMHAAVEAAASDLSGTSGRIALLILSDGYELQASPVPAVQALKQQYGDRLCVYSVWVGNKHEENGKLLLNSLSDIAGCGFRADAENIATPDGMAEFVKNVFLKPAAPAAAPGCESLDSDGDGVNDCNDRCPDTLKGAHVNQFGCWIVDVKFDNDKSNIKPEYHEELDRAAQVINNNPGVTIEVQGHTSNTASAEYNQKLSERRATAVANYLSKHVGSNAALTPVGYGLTHPIDTNDTEEGRANNRRVELKVIR